MHKPQLTTMSGAARYLGMSRSWIRDAIASGQLAHVRLGRSVRLRYLDLDRVIVANRVRPEPGSPPVDPNQ
jgi:excisionase family DNA binding protein